MGLICLQGGNEFDPRCRDMDAFLLDAAGGGPVLVLPYAAMHGRSYHTAGANAVRYYRDLGAADVTVAPLDVEQAARTASEASLLVLPGGSPRRLHAAVRGTPLHDALANAAADPSCVVTGSSAGAMLLCDWTVLPEPLAIGRGLGLVDDFAVIPHYSGPKKQWEDVLREADPSLDLLGIPECSGVLIDGENVTAIGADAATLITEDGRERLAYEP